MKKRQVKKENYVEFSNMKQRALRSSAFRKAYVAAEPKYAVIRALLDARVKDGLTQKEIARRAGTTQSAIARFEAGEVNPTLDFLSRVSSAVGMKLTVHVSR